MKGGLYREEDLGQYSCHDVLTSYCGLETAVVLQQEGLFKCLNSIRCCLGHGTKAKQEIDLIHEMLAASTGGTQAEGNRYKAQVKCIV